MATSLSGWPGIYSGDPRLKTFTIPGTASKALPRGRRVTLRADVGPYLVAAAAEWNRRIDTLNEYTGGHIYRNARFSDRLSDHAAGTALDLSWNKFPMGKRGTMSKSQIREVRKIMDEFEGMAWGGEWGGGPDGDGHTYDPMHIYLEKNDISFYLNKMNEMGIDNEGYQTKATKVSKNIFVKNKPSDKEHDEKVLIKAEADDIKSRKAKLVARRRKLMLLTDKKSKAEKAKLDLLISELDKKIKNV